LQALADVSWLGKKDCGLASFANVQIHRSSPKETKQREELDHHIINGKILKYRRKKTKRGGRKAKKTEKGKLK